MIKEQEDKFGVDPDWVMPQLRDLLRDCGRLDQEVRSATTPISTHPALLSIACAHPDVASCALLEQAESVGLALKLTRNPSET